MSSILITGGAGFIGSHLTEALLAQGHRVAVLDDLSSGSIENLRAVRSNPRLEMIPEKVENLPILAEMVDRADLIYHLAATVGVFNIIDSPVATILNNIGGTEAVLKMARKKRKKVIVASTSEVYGKSKALPFHEEGDLVSGPTSKSRWSYAVSKAIDEFLALAYWREFHVPTVVVRLFNTIGPRQVGRYGMVVPRFLRQAMEGADLTVFGTGQQSRCFTYVTDIVQWLMILGWKEEAVGNVFNLGNPQEISIQELAERIITLTGSAAKVRHIPYEEAYEEGFEDMQRRIPDIDKVLKLTGYAPRVTLDQALQSTLNWFMETAELERFIPEPASTIAASAGSRIA
jgi:UDP-glucose 4-epimerase